MDLHRCPGCSAAVRPEAQWCSLCYLDLRPKRCSAPAAGPSGPSGALPIGTVPGQRSAVDVQLAAPAPVGWPCTTCGNVVPIHLDACSSCGASFLARLQSEGRHRSDSGTGTLSGLTRLSRSARLGVGVLLGLVLALLVPALMALLG